MTTTDQSLGHTLFKYRDYTPVPLVLLLLIVADPSVFSATLGTCLVIFGELIRIYSVAFIGSISRTRKESLGDNLITKGPFALVRNPLYVGNFFITFGIGIFSGHLWFAVLAAAFFYFQYNHIVAYEEGLLERKFGKEFRAYKDEVPAWVPKAVPRLEEMEWPDSYTTALKSETRTLTAIGAALLLLGLLG